MLNYLFKLLLSVGGEKGGFEPFNMGLSIGNVKKEAEDDD